MIERAQARCAMCGAPLDEEGECSSGVCRSRQETIRPRHSHPRAIRKPVPSGDFTVRKSPSTTLNDLLRGTDSDHGPTDATKIPAQAPLPEFSDEVLAESEYYARAPDGDTLSTERGVPSSKPPPSKR